MKQEKFNLYWHTYNDHLREMLRNMMSSNELTDVTIVSEDKKHFKAHKVVLSASSSVFQSIISDSTLSSPIIYLRGIDSPEIESILQFIYLGEVTFYQERMKEFLDVAESLEIKGISKDVEIPENKPHDNVDSYGFVQENEFLQNVLLQNETVPERMSINQKNSQLKKNTENNYPCDHCDYKSLQSGNLQQHIKSIHEGVKFPCDQCNYKAAHSSTLKQHIKSKHDGVRYPCDHCNYESSVPKNLRRHIRSFHLESN